MEVRTIYKLDLEEIKTAVKQYVREIENGSEGGAGTVLKVEVNGSYHAERNEWTIVEAVVTVSHD